MDPDARDHSAADPPPATAHALVYDGPGAKAWEEVPMPTLNADTDAIVRVDATTICGTDLHIGRAISRRVTGGRILGHEAVGTVEAVGRGVRPLRPGDRVLVLTGTHDA